MSTQEHVAAAEALLADFDAKRLSMKQVKLAFEAMRELLAERAALREALTEAVQSLEYVEHMHPTASGGFKRHEDIKRATLALKATP